MSKNFLSRNKRFLSPAALFAGFVVDNFTLTRIDLLFDNLVLLSYLAIAGMGIIVMQLYKNEILRGRSIDGVASWLPLLIQFAFGGLFSGYFIFYTRSATISTSWLFIILILALLIGNEFFRKRYMRFVFQMSIFYICIFSFLIFFIPVISGKLGAGVFILSGSISLLVIGIFYLFFARVTPYDIKRYGSGLILSIGVIYVAMNVLYFTNIIPPVPLSLKDIGVYYSVERMEDGNYQAIEERRKWYDVLYFFNTKIYRTMNAPVYVYSSIFAPTDLNTEVAHIWEYYDEIKNEWVVSSKIEFPIYGGRGDGYRGFSFKENIFAGKWRVNVVTSRGALIGRKTFLVIDTVNGNSIPELSTTIL